MMNPEQDGPGIEIPPLRETEAADAVKRAGLRTRLGNLAFGLVIGAILAGGSFFYGLDIGRRTAPQAEPPLVRAEPGPIKELPEDPGGLDVPFRDRLVFDGVRDPVAEVGEAALAEAAEEPLPAATPAGDEEADATDAADAGFIVVEPGEAEVAAAPPPPSPLPNEVPAPTQAVPAGEGVPIVITGAEIAAADAAVEEPTTVPAAEPEAQDAPAPAPAETETAAAVEPLAAPTAPVQLAAAPTPFRIQVGAYRSEAAALNGWNLLAVAHRELLAGLRPTIVEIDLGPGRGIFHRLQAGPVADRRAASALCDALRAREQGCLVVGP